MNEANFIEFFLFSSGFSVELDMKNESKNCLLMRSVYQCLPNVVRIFFFFGFFIQLNHLNVHCEEAEACLKLGHKGVPKQPPTQFSQLKICRQCFQNISHTLSHISLYPFHCIRIRIRCRIDNLFIECKQH